QIHYEQSYLNSRTADRENQRGHDGAADFREECFHKHGELSDQMEGSEDDVDELDSNNRNDDAADTVDEQVALQRRERADGRVFNAAQRQRNERNDDERVENDGA